MKYLNEYMARRCNEEDGCKGRFWEGRFKSQALLDEQGILIAMAYVDLNPVRAGIATTPEASDFTSIYDRIHELQRAVKPHTGPLVPLLPFRDSVAASGLSKAIPFSFRDYLELVDWTGKHITMANKACIGRKLPGILRRLQIEPAPWANTMRPSGNLFGRAIARPDRLRTHAWNLDQGWIRGMALSRRIFKA